MRGFRFLSLLAVIVVLAAGAALAQQAPPAMRGDGPPPVAKPFSITRTDPALDALVAPRAKAEVFASGFGLNEGPVWVREGQSGYLIVGGLLDNVLYKISADKKVSVLLRTGSRGWCWTRRHSAGSPMASCCHPMSTTCTSPRGRR